MNFPIVTVPQLSAHLRALRKARRWTQADVGRLLGVKQSRIADIERDPGSVSVAQMHKLLSALGAQLILHDSGGGWQPMRPNDPAQGEAAGPATSLEPPATHRTSGSW